MNPKMIADKKLATGMLNLLEKIARKYTENNSSPSIMIGKIINNNGLKASFIGLPVKSHFKICCKNTETAALITTLIKKYLAIFLTGATGFENIFFVSFLPKTSVNAINPVIVKEKMLIMDGANSNPNKPSTTTIVPNIPFLSSIFFPKMLFMIITPTIQFLKIESVYMKS